MKPPEEEDLALRLFPAKRFDRRRLLTSMGGAVAGLSVAARLDAASTPEASQAPAPSPATPAATTWRPLATAPAGALSSHELETLGHLAETLIPATETPGARSAGVHFYLDDVCRTEPETRSTLQRGIAAIDARCRGQSGAPFTELDADRQAALLTAFMEGSPEERMFFRFLRARVIDGYCKSEVGQIGELGWSGHEFHDAFPGACQHPDGAHHPRPSWPRT